MKWNWNDVSMDYVIIMLGFSSSRCCCSHDPWKMTDDFSFFWRFSICWVSWCSWCSGLLRIHWQHEPNKAVQLVRLQVVQQFLGWMRTHRHLRTATQTTNHFEYASNMRLYKGTFKIELCKKHPWLLSNIAWDSSCSVIKYHPFIDAWLFEVSTCINHITWFSH